MLTGHGHDGPNGNSSDPDYLVIPMSSKEAQHIGTPLDNIHSPTAFFLTIFLHWGRKQRNVIIKVTTSVSWERRFRGVEWVRLNSHRWSATGQKWQRGQGATERTRVLNIDRTTEYRCWRLVQWSFFLCVFIMAINIRTAIVVQL